jgi:hypothetical protein
MDSSTDGEEDRRLEDGRLKRRAAGLNFALPAERGFLPTVPNGAGNGGCKSELRSRRRLLVRTPARRTASDLHLPSSIFYLLSSIFYSLA